MGCVHNSGDFFCDSRPGCVGSSEHHITHVVSNVAGQPYKSELPGTVGHPVHVKELLEVQRHDLTR